METEFFQKHIHYDADLEAAVLGACLLEQTAMGRIYDLLGENVFYYPDNQAVFRALKTMYENSHPIDMLTVVNYIVNNKIKLLEENPAWYVTSLTNHVCSSAHIEYHALLLRDMWRRRELVKLKAEPNGDADLQEQIRRISEGLGALSEREIVQDWFAMDELMFELIKHQQEIKEGKKNFITTGFKAIDRANGGFSPGQMITIGARPAVGKTALMGKMALAMAEQGKCVGIVSLEMNNTEIAGRLAALETGFDFSTIYRNLFKDENDSERFYDIISKRSIHKPIYVSSKTGVDVPRIKSKALKLRHQHGLDVLFIDYLQLVDSTTTNRNYSREQEVSKLSRGLKLLAMDLQIPVIVLCQLNRAIAQTKDPKHRYPELHHLRESGSIEQDSDIVAMLHRDWLAGFHEDGNGNSTERQADLLWRKWRNGATLHLPLDFDPERMRFSEKTCSNLKPIAQEVVEEEEPF